jgi:hypothetical protein
MWPRLRLGDEAELTDRSHRRIREGDVVVARVSDKLVIHRVVAVAEDRVLLRGDNAAAPDPPIPRENILGIVLRVRRGGAVLEAAAWDRRPGALRLLTMRIREGARLLCSRSL